MSEPLLCPKCGALVGKHLKRCYQCNTFLMGSRFEELFLGLLPERAQKSPATSLLIFFCAVPFLFVLLAIGPSVLGIIPSYTMTQIGATSSALIVMDQYWRFVTANFVHFNALHIGMNVLGLVYLGPFIEEMFDYKKCFVIFFITGTLTFAAFLGVEFAIPRLFSSSLAGGASAGIFGLLGAGVAGAKKHAWNSANIRKMLIKNFLLNLVLGLIILPLGSNVLHVFGFSFGYGIAYFIPVGEGVPGFERKFFSYAFLGSVLIILACFAFQIREIINYPLTVSTEDFDSRIKQCLRTEPDPKDSQDITQDRIQQAIKVCEITLREGVNYPKGIVDRLRYYAELYPNLLDGEQLQIDSDRMERFFPRPD